MFHLSNVCDDIISDLAKHWGINRSAVVEVAIRRFYKYSRGRWPEITDNGILDQRKDR